MEADHDYTDPRTVDATPDPQAIRKPWISPQLIELPRLTELTLVTGSPIPGIGNPGSGTVF